MKKLPVILLILSLFFSACKEDKKRKEYSSGFGGLGKFGNPDLVLDSLVNSINLKYTRDGEFPSVNVLINMLPKNIMFIYYSVSDDSYQISYWSGETTWIYDFKTDSYYETTKDMIQEKWYDVKKKTPIDKENIQYHSLIIKN